MAYPQGVPEVQAAGRRLQVSGEGLRPEVRRGAGKGGSLCPRQGRLPEEMRGGAAAGHHSGNVHGEKGNGEGPAFPAEGASPRWTFLNVGAVRGAPLRVLLAVEILQGRDIGLGIEHAEDELAPGLGHAQGRFAVGEHAADGIG